jgi:hypothetical protein
MGVLATSEPGILLTAVFEVKSKTLKKDVAAVAAKLTALQKKLKLEGFVTASKREGNTLTVKVLAAGPVPAAASARAPKARGKAWSAGAKSAADVGAEVEAKLGWEKKR